MTHYYVSKPVSQGFFDDIWKGIKGVAGVIAGQRQPVIIQQQPATPPWLLPALLGVGAIVLVVVLKKKKDTK